jgi:hypothetical protein
VSLERNAELGRTLELGLAAATPDAGARQRIERHLNERLSAPPRSRAAWLTLSAAVAVGALVLLLGPRFLRHTTAPSAASWLSFTAARARLLEGGKLEVERDDARGTELRLLAGAALFHVQKGTGRSFVVHAGADRVAVVGTVFGVSVEAGHAAVEVREGVVELSAEGVTRRLSAGQTWPPDTDLFSRPGSELGELSAPILGRHLTPAPTSGIPTTAVSELPLSPIPAPVRAKPSPSAPWSSSTASPPSANSSAYQQARELERRGAHAEAIAAFEAIARASDAYAEDAAFALVRVPAQNGEPEAALAAAEAYRHAYPSGRYARDVDVLELGAHLALHDEHAALRDADEFLRRFPDDARAWRFVLVRAAGHARAGHCDLALRELASVPDGSAKASVLERCPAP